MDHPPRPASPGPHDNTKALHWGPPITPATKCVVIFIHGRGSSPDEDLPVFEGTFAGAGGEVSAIGLRAQDEIWYPGAWSNPPATQEPYLSSAISLIHNTITSLPVPPSRIILLGFSQGAALALTYALAHPRRYGGILALSGSVLGVPEDWPAQEGGLEGTKLYIAWGDKDRFRGMERAEEEVKAFGERGAEVELQVFPGMGHWVTDRELERLGELMREVVELA